ncbi:MAG: diaminopimelate epimerase [Chlamydiales bacterium]|nr:diaminopimelate epimerase [Chlamydiales bacterium]
MQIRFSKYSGCGNDFIIIDNRSFFFPLHNEHYVRQLCHRRLGIGADGIILLEPSSKSDFRMRILNSDGTEAEMCGNGIRCLMRFIVRLYPNTSKCVVETGAGLIALKAEGICVQAAMHDPFDMQWNLQVEGLCTHYMNTGVPHAVCFVDDVQTVDLDQVGKKLRWHTQYGPKGANVNFAAIDSQANCIRYRTFERGVEGETLACGTGAVAVALAAAQVLKQQAPVTILTSSGQKLIIGFEHDGHKFRNITMTGPADHVFDGQFICQQTNQNILSSLSVCDIV